MKKVKLFLYEVNHLNELSTYNNFSEFIKKQAEGRKLIAHCEDDQPRKLLQHELKKGENIHILIGPEGDFSRKEIKQALEHKWNAVSLGDSRLRTETAALVAIAKWHRWNYVNGDPRAPRQIEELEFDGSAVKDDDLHYLWENIQPHFPHRDKMSELILLNFNDTEFTDRWMTNLIGIDKTGYPYRTEGLKTLLLENTQISDVGLKMLYVHVPKLQPQAPKIQQEENSSYAMTNLLELSVYGCEDVTKKGISELQKALPNLKIISTFNPN